MAKTKDVSDPVAVTAFIQKLDPSLAKIAEAIRIIILNTDKSIGEQIKWNSPSFFYTGAMKPFDPKEYRRDIAVMNIRKGNVLLVLPTGAKVTEATGILEGSYTDGRRLVTFNNLDDVDTKKKDLQKVVEEWLMLIDR